MGVSNPTDRSNGVFSYLLIRQGVRVDARGSWLVVRVVTRQYNSQRIYMFDKESIRGPKVGVSNINDVRHHPMPCRGRGPC